MIKKIIFLVLIICLLFSPVMAKQTINSSLNITDVKSNSITWSYVYLTDNRPIGATLDGINIEGFKTDLVYNYTANNLQPNTFHEFCLYGEVTSNCEGIYTLEDTDEIYLFIVTWLFLIIAVICIALQVYGIPFMAYIGFIFALLGLLSNMNNSFMIMTIYGIVIITSIFVGLSKE